MAVITMVFASECRFLRQYNLYLPTYRASSQWRMVNSLLLATIMRTVFIIVSYGSKVPAGIFVPSLAVGATFGRMIGILVKAMYK